MTPELPLDRLIRGFCFSAARFHLSQVLVHCLVYPVHGELVASRRRLRSLGLLDPSGEENRNVGRYRLHVGLLVEGRDL